jgi:hypothetical protein
MKNLNIIFDDNDMKLLLRVKRKYGTWRNVIISGAKLLDSEVKIDINKLIDEVK